MKRKTTTGCPKCGGGWKLLSGFYICAKCGHRLGSQRFTGPQIVLRSPLTPVDAYERETNIVDPPGKLRNPLDFKL